MRDVERRPVLCSFKRNEGGSAYQKNLLKKNKKNKAKKQGSLLASFLEQKHFRLLSEKPQALGAEDNNHKFILTITNSLLNLSKPS